MAKKALVIVESPSKAKTIQKYLGRDYIVKASVGHIKDLPKSKLGVDPSKSFAVDYQIIPAKAKVIEELKKYAAKVPVLYLATDPDREGEAIAWHIRDELKTRGKKIHRVLFNAVTKASILEAIANPLELNADKFHAQQARRVLDRLVGYKISPLLWDKVRRGLSAGRVQSVAVRIVVDRETEIKAFVPVEYWSVDGIFEKDSIEFKARLFKIDGKDPGLSNQSTIDQLVPNLTQTKWSVDSLEKKERTRKPTPPFITSRLQQEAARKLGFSAKKTMTLAQRLYEGIDLGDLGTHGLITYMRTDSVRVEPVALEQVREHIKQTYGPEFLPKEAIQYKTKKSAQDAHEAIRPTSLEFSPERIQGFLENDVQRLYQLIWNRFVASQMNQAIYDQTTLDLKGEDSSGTQYTFRATGSVLKFAGFTAVYMETSDDAPSSTDAQTHASQQDDDKVLRLPSLNPKDPVNNVSVSPHQHFTQPPPRFSDASLIKDLEEKGIGRPSTYATILSNIQDREYVEKREGKYYPSELGSVVTELLVDSFPDVLNFEFTSAMEDQLDSIEEGKTEWKKALRQFWKPFEKTLETAKKQMKNIKRIEVPTELKCEKCDHTMMIKWGKLGSFLACSNYPECKNTQDFKKDDEGKIIIVPKEFTDKKCKTCQNPMVVKSGKYGRFLACSDYPNCKYTTAITLGIKCPKCPEGEIAQRRSRFGRVFYSCNQWPDCDFAIWDKPVEQPCPDCKFPLLTEKITKKAGLMHKCSQKECGYINIIDADYGKNPPVQVTEPA